MSYRPFQSIIDAKRLLEIQQDILRPSKEDIQKAFAQAARKYHPDGRHHLNAQPCAIQFRQCVQARDLLLHHYYGPSPSRPYTRPPPSSGNNQYHHYRYNNNTYASSSGTHNDYFAKGFPFQTLRLLTLKQKLVIRGAIMVLVSAGALYDKWVRMENQRLREEDEKRTRAAF